VVLTDEDDLATPDDGRRYEMLVGEIQVSDAVDAASARSGGEAADPATVRRSPDRSRGPLEYP
jgi:hypothetical protein